MAKINQIFVIAYESNVGLWYVKVFVTYQDRKPYSMDFTPQRAIDVAAAIIDPDGVHSVIARSNASVLLDAIKGENSIQVAGNMERMAVICENSNTHAVLAEKTVETRTQLIQ